MGSDDKKTNNQGSMDQWTDVLPGPLGALISAEEACWNPPGQTTISTQVDGL